jgi:molybdopterin-guanine dinucleotide biosynthesis protein A
MIDTDAFILIGGRSSRMGRDKALVELGGQTLAERALSTVRQALPGRRVTFVARNAAQFGIEAIAAGAPFVFDLIEGRGPLGGLHTALSYARTEWIFVMACDYPFVSAELIDLLGGQISDEFGAVVPEQPDGRLQPLCAFYNVATAFHVVDEIIQKPRVPPPMHEIAKQITPLIVEYHEYIGLNGSDHFFENINTLAELDRASEIERKLSADLQIK